MSTTNTTKLDAAILANRACPCDAHKNAVMAAMAAQNNRFMSTQTADFQRRTH